MTLLTKNFTKNKLNQKYLNKIAEKTLEVVKFKEPVEISLVVTGEKRIKSLNKKYRKVDKITDVLSFGGEYEWFAKRLHSSVETMELTCLGEVFICYSQVVKQAKQKNNIIKKELAILLIHGILHLLGYDHQGNYENSEMKVLEEKILKNYSTAL